MNNDELQKAIDDITKDNAAAEAAPAVDAAAENEQLANELTQATAPAPAATDYAATPDFGVAPAPAVPEAPGMPPVDAPEAPEAPAAAEPEVPEVEVPEIEVPEIPKAPVAEPETEAEPEAEEPVVATTAGDGDTLNEALKELYPLLDKVDMPVADKFDITMKFGGPAKALEFAKKIPDETAKANALLEIVNRLK